MKTFAAILASSLLALSLAACSASSSAESDAAADSSASTAESEPAPTRVASIGEDSFADMPALRPTPPTPASVNATLQPVTDFMRISDTTERSLALWEEAFKVVGHPRCMNCHNIDGPVTQGDAMMPHQPMIARGPDTFGNVGMKCSTCHGAENVDYVGAQGSIPGHDPWHVAPIEMGWQGLSSGEICEKIKNTDTNGDRTLEEIWEHHAKDGLVGWAWEPGAGRTPAPGTQELFGELTRAWIDTGAVCPS